MEVTYKTTLDDFVAYNMHLLKRSPSMRQKMVLSWVLLPIVCLFWAYILANPYPFSAVFLVVAGVFIAIFYPLIYRGWVASSVRAYAQDLDARGVIGQITLILEEDTLTERAGAVQSVVRWQEMKGMEIVGEVTYVYVTGLLAAIIPKHGFERSEDYESVQAFVLAKLRDKQM